MRIPLGPIVSAFCLSGMAAQAAAQPAPTPSTDAGEPLYALDPALDIPVSALGLALSIPALLEVAPPACLPDSCNASEINAFDRAAVGNYSESLKGTADILVFGLIGLPVLIDAFDADFEPWLVDTAVFAETLILTQGLTQLVKAAVRRSAPFVYDESLDLEIRRDTRDGPRSFWSGHAATAFAAATCYTVTFWERHPDSPWRWVVLGASAALATTIGVLKVEAGYHYWTDILAGAGAGISVGFLVPWLHRF